MTAAVSLMSSLCRPTPPHNRDKRWREGGGGGQARFWQSGGGGGGLNRGGAPPPSSVPHPSSAFPHLSTPQRSANPSRAPSARSRPPHQNQTHLPPASQYRNDESNAPQTGLREQPGPKAQLEPLAERGVASRSGRGAAGRGGSSGLVDDASVSQVGPGEQDSISGAPPAAASPQPSGYRSTSPRRPQEQRSGADRIASGSTASGPSQQLTSSAVSGNREASPPAERPVERKSYSLARRTRSRPSDLGSKQASVDESGAGGSSSSPNSGGGKSWAGGEGGSQTGGGGMADLDQDVARLSLARQNWSQSPTSYVRSEMRGESCPES